MDKDISKVTRVLLVGIFVAIIAIHGWIVTQDTFKGPQKQPSHQPPNIILFCWDGCQPEHLQELILEDKLPNVLTILPYGSFEIYVEYEITQTKNVHATMLTGYEPNVTGVYYNQKMIHPVPKGLTFLERVEEYYGDENVATALITGKTENVGKIFMNNANGIDVFHAEDLDIYDLSPMMINFLEESHDRHFVVFFHSRNPDNDGHLKAENSQRYSDGIIHAYNALMLMIDKLDEHKIHDRTLIYLITDHGFEEGGLGHKHEHRAWLFTNDPSFNRGQDMILYRDIAPTLYTILDINYTSYEPHMRGIPLQDSLTEKEDGRRQALMATLMAEEGGSS